MWLNWCWNRFHAGGRFTATTCAVTSITVICRRIAGNVRVESILAVSNNSSCSRDCSITNYTYYTAAVTTWSGNTAHGGNRFDFNGSGTINNSGTWNDANAFNSTLGAGNSGTKAFNNIGTYNKTPGSARKRRMNS